MRFIALLVILAFSAGILSSLREELVRQNTLHEKEVQLQEIEVVGQFCESQSGSVDYKTGDLKCNSKKQAERKKFQPKEMPDVI